MGALLMRYVVRFVEDYQLPEGQDWALVEGPDYYVAFLKRERVSPSLLAEAWAGYTVLSRRSFSVRV